MTKIFISNNPENLNGKLEDFEHTVTVEAEYGDQVIEGTVSTLAHHGPRSGNLCPCLSENFSNVPVHAIGISHMDLDTLGGLRAVLSLKSMFEQGDHMPARGNKYPERLFWEVAARVDVEGPHRLNKIFMDLGLSESTLTKVSGWLHAFWAWSQENRLFPPRDGSVEDVTEWVTTAQKALDQILESVPGDALWDAGEAWKKAQNSLRAESFEQECVGENFSVVLRRSDKFVNHLYENTRGESKPMQAVVGWNPDKGTVTVSVADTIEGFSCGEFVKELWGPEAGGHATIGGSPRSGLGNPQNEAHRAFEELLEKLRSL